MMLGWLRAEAALLMLRRRLFRLGLLRGFAPGNRTDGDWTIDRRRSRGAVDDAHAAPSPAFQDLKWRWLLSGKAGILMKKVSGRGSFGSSIPRSGSGRSSFENRASRRAEGHSGAISSGNCALPQSPARPDTRLGVRGNFLALSPFFALPIRQGVPACPKPPKSAPNGRGFLSIARRSHFVTAEVKSTAAAYDAGPVVELR